MIRRAFVAVVMAAVVLGVATPAFAHVTVQPSEAEQGGFAAVAFQVPNERDDANTVKVEVTFPADHPIPFVSTQPVEPAGERPSIDGAEPGVAPEAFGFRETERPARLLQHRAALRGALPQRDEVAVLAVAHAHQQERERARQVRRHRQQVAAPAADAELHRGERGPLAEPAAERLEVRLRVPDRVRGGVALLLRRRVVTREVAADLPDHRTEPARVEQRPEHQRQAGGGVRRR